LNKSPKHRGLIKAEPDLEKAKKHITKAEHNLRAFLYFDKGGFSDWSVSAGFYCIYHCFLAIAAKFGYESRNQSCTIALIELLKENGKINIDPKFIEMLKSEDYNERHESTVIELREEYAYGITTSVERAKITKLIEACKDVLDITKELVNK
jgi:uncharacterized protein (UPF0332 family)